MRRGVFVLLLVLLLVSDLRRLSFRFFALGACGRRTGERCRLGGLAVTLLGDGFLISRADRGLTVGVVGFGS